MNPVTQSRPSPLVLRWLLAPAHWLERTRGRKRMALVALYLVILAALAVLGWRAVSLNGLPDIEVPFDVEAFRSFDVPEGENAFTLYRQAVAKLKPFKAPEGRTVNRLARIYDWSKADPSYHQWVEDNREALGLWLRGADRDRAVNIPPGEAGPNVFVGAGQELHTFADLALLEASRREQAGDVAGAWEMYRVVFRSSRHDTRAADFYQRMVASNVLRRALGPVQRWTNDPRVDAELLRRAAEDLRACEAMSAPPSETLKVEYLRFLKAVDEEPDVVFRRVQDRTLWYHNLPLYTRALLFLKREPERSRRVAKLLLANLLPYCDRPVGRRPPTWAEPETPTLYRPGPEAPASAHALGPEAIARWYRSTEALRELTYLHAQISILGEASVEPTLLASLRMEMAVRRYTLERGAPPKRLGELVGRYVDALPEGYEPDDAPAAANPPSSGPGAP